MVRPSRRASSLALIAIALVLALAGCGGSSGSNGVESKSAQQILEATKAAASSAVSVHIEGSIQANGKPISLDMELLAGKGGKGTISQEGFTVQIVQSGGAVYINGSSAFYTHVAGPTAAALLQGKWLKAPAGSGELASLASLTDLGKLLDTALSGHGAVTKGPVKTVNGQKAIELRDATKDGSLFVATTGQPYPLQILKSGGETGKVTFDRWNKPVTITAPAGAIDISKLQGGG
jgi:hypothetical protein